MNARRFIRAGVRRFHRDQGGQGILFAAASIVVLVAFVSLAFNVGAAVAQRTRVQMSADAMAYSGAVIQANALSSVAWINSGMAQTYYRLMRHSVDLGVTAVAAELERRASMAPDGVVNAAAWQATEAFRAYSEAKGLAREQIPLARDFVRDLSRIENAIAIVTPELVWDEMFAVGEANGSERMAIFPYQRMFPHDTGELSYRVEKLADGWRITNLNSQNGEMVSVRLIGGDWHIQYTNGDTTTYEWVVTQESSTRWAVRLYDGSGALDREIFITQTDDGWLVSNNNAQLQIESVTRGGHRGTAITYQGVTQIIRRSGGRLYKWDEWNSEWVDMSQDTIQVGDCTLNVHSSNAISVGPMTVYIGDPPHVSVGGASMTLQNPPWISVTCGLLHIGISGFSADDYSITLAGHSLTSGNADGRWHMYFNNQSKLWWRHRLTEQEPIYSDALQQWQYDYQVLGAILRYENNPERFAVRHAILNRYADQGEYAPESLIQSDTLWQWKPELQWTRWYDPTASGPRDMSVRQRFSGSISYPALYSNPTPIDDDCRDKTYFLTRCGCPACAGVGWYQDASSNWRICRACGARDYDGDGRSDIRVFLGEVINARGSSRTWSNDSDAQSPVRVPEDHVDLRLFGSGGDTRWPLVLTEEFFKWGFNAGTWRSAEAQPMTFSREPDWGYVAIASARIGIADAPADGEPAWVRYRFQDPDEREDWVENDVENFYRADLAVKLVSSRKQIADYDMDETLLQGTSLGVTADTGTAFLWRAIITGRPGNIDEASLWYDERNGQSDFLMSERLGNMRNRQGRTFDYASPEMPEVIRH